MNTKIIAVIALVVVLVGGWFLLRGSNTEVVPEENINPAGIVEEGTGVNDGPAGGEAVNVKEFTVTGSNFSFAPKILNVNKGDTVKITFVNSVGFHDLVIDEFDVATKQLQAGQSETITFVADQVGSFEYYCSVGTHRQMGMWGTLTVNE